MGWDRHKFLWDGMGWNRKICPMDKPFNMCLADMILISIICEKNYKEKDAKIQCMMLYKWTKCLSCPAHQQTFWIFLHDIICLISVPNMHGSSGRH